MNDYIEYDFWHKSNWLSGFLIFIHNTAIHDIQCLKDCKSDISALYQVSAIL